MNGWWLAAWLFCTWVLPCCLTTAALAHYLNLTRPGQVLATLVSTAAIGPLLTSRMVTWLLYLPGQHSRDELLVYGLLVLGCATFLLRRSLVRLPALLRTRPNQPTTVNVIVGVTPWVVVYCLLLCVGGRLPIFANDPLQYATASRALLRAGSMWAYPFIEPTGDYWAATAHPPGIYGVFAWGAAFRLPDLAARVSAILLAAALPLTIGVAVQARRASTWLVLGLLPLTMSAWMGPVLHAHTDPQRLYTLALLAVMLPLWLRRRDRPTTVLCGLALGLVIYAHSLGLLYLGFVPVTLWLIADRNVATPNAPRLTTQIVVMATVALLTGGEQYVRNVFTFGSPFNDQVAILQLDSLHHEALLRWTRTLQTVKQRWINGILAPWSMPNRFSLVYWFATIAAIVSVTARGMRTANRRHHDPLLKVALWLTGMFFGLVCASALGNNDTLIRNTRYLLTTLPFLLVILGIFQEQLTRRQNLLWLGLIVLSSIQPLAELHSAVRNLQNTYQTDKLRWLEPDEVKFALARSPELKAVRAARELSQPEDRFLIGRLAGFARYAGRSYRRDIDPRLLPFYSSRSVTEAMDVLHQMQIRFLYLPPYPVASMMHPWSKAIIRSPKRSTILYADNGYRIARLSTPERDEEPKHWIRQTVLGDWSMEQQRSGGTPYSRRTNVHLWPVELRAEADPLQRAPLLAYSGNPPLSVAPSRTFSSPNIRIKADHRVRLTAKFQGRGLVSAELWHYDPANGSLIDSSIFGHVLLDDDIGDREFFESPWLPVTAPIEARIFLRIAPGSTLSVSDVAIDVTTEAPAAATSTAPKPVFSSSVAPRQWSIWRDGHKHPLAAPTSSDAAVLARDDTSADTWLYTGTGPINVAPAQSFDEVLLLPAGTTWIRTATVIQANGPISVYAWFYDAEGNATAIFLGDYYPPDDRARLLPLTIKVPRHMVGFRLSFLLRADQPTSLLSASHLKLSYGRDIDAGLSTIRQSKREDRQTDTAEFVDLTSELAVFPRGQARLLPHPETTTTTVIVDREPQGNLWLVTVPDTFAAQLSDPTKAVATCGLLHIRLTMDGNLVTEPYAILFDATGKRTEARSLGRLYPSGHRPANWKRTVTGLTDGNNALAVTALRLHPDRYPAQLTVGPFAISGACRTPENTQTGE